MLIQVSNLEFTPNTVVRVSADRILWHSTSNVDKVETSRL